MPESHHSNGTEPLLPTHRDSVPVPLSSPVTMEDSIEAAMARPLPMTPPLEVQGGGGGYVSVSPISGRYPGIAPLSPSVGQPGSSSRPPSGVRLGVGSGVYYGEGQQHEADIADLASHGDERRTRPGPTRRATAPLRNASVEDEKQALEWIVPNVGNGNGMKLHRGASTVERGFSVGERLRKTHEAAVAEKQKYETKARHAGLAINVVTFTQIISNALITGLSAATTNRHAQIGVSALGAMNTIISSFLVRVRASQEPERSTAHAESLGRYCRELEAFMDDEGGSYDRKWDADIKRFRGEFDRLQRAAQQSQSGQLVESESKPAVSETTPGPTNPGPMTSGPGKMV